MDIFLQASRARIRFASPKGFLETEDLWDLPLSSTVPGKANLDDVARDLHRQLKEKEEISFVTKGTKPDGLLQLQFDVVKVVIDTRLAENEAAAIARVKAEKRQKLLELIARKEDDQLSATSLEELRAMLD